jgi:hypothetical protein
VSLISAIHDDDAFHADVDERKRAIMHLLRTTARKLSGPIAAIDSLRLVGVKYIQMHV